MEEMEGFGVCDWGFQEGIDDLKHRLLYTIVELEAVRVKSEEEIRKNEEHIKKLLELVRVTIKQIDEARDQLRRLLSNPFPIENSYPLASTYNLESPPFMPSEFESFNSCSSPMISFPEPISSFNPSSINFGDSGPSSQGISSYQSCNNLPVPLASFGPGELVKFDKAEMVIEHLVANKPLPEKGKLIQAVMEAGPLLKTLLVAGSLPRWRNPPPLQIIKGGRCDGRILSSSSIGMVNFDGLHFAEPSGLLYQRKWPPLLSSNYQINSTGKRQKSH